MILPCDDQAVLSPDDSQIAFVSTRETHRANIWILDLNTKQFRSLTGRADVQGNPMKPDGFFRPSGRWYFRAKRLEPHNHHHLLTL
jgi:Tol biopolymer transport system component